MVMRFVKKIDFIIRLLLIIIVTVIFAFAVMIAMVLKGKNIFHPFARKWSKALLWISNVNVIINNHSQFTENKSYIYVANHSSLFDIPVLLACLPDYARIMYKEELEKIPVFGWCLKMSPFISVKREDPSNALQSFRNALDVISKDESVIIFPEGTRSLDGNLGEFKKGAFMLAFKSGKEIIPVSIQGTSDIMPKGKLEFFKGRVVLNLFDKINPNSPDFSNVNNLLKFVRNIIQNSH